MNTTRVVSWLTSAAGAITGGSLFAFSTLVMPALNKIPKSEAIDAMNAINDVAPKSLFIVPLISSAIGSVVVGGCAITQSPVPNRRLLIAGAAAGVAGFLVTMAYHVPHNDALARAGASADWTSYAVPWNAWNHVRMVLALASSAAIAVGLMRRAKSPING